MMKGASSGETMVLHYLWLGGVTCAMVIFMWSSGFYGSVLKRTVSALKTQQITTIKCKRIITITPFCSFFPFSLLRFLDFILKFSSQPPFSSLLRLWFP
jgi:hypothetical protein